jgi:hypothetical protein
LLKDVDFDATTLKDWEASSDLRDEALWQRASAGVEQKNLDRFVKYIKAKADPDKVLHELVAIGSSNALFELALRHGANPNFVKEPKRRVDSSDSAPPAYTVSSSSGAEKGRNSEKGVLIGDEVCRLENRGALHLLRNTEQFDPLKLSDVRYRNFVLQENVNDFAKAGRVDDLKAYFRSGGPGGISMDQTEDGIRKGVIKLCGRSLVDLVAKDDAQALKTLIKAGMDPNVRFRHYTVPANETVPFAHVIHDSIVNVRAKNAFALKQAIELRFTSMNPTNGRTVVVDRVRIPKLQQMVATLVYAPGFGISGRGSGASLAQLQIEAEGNTAANEAFERLHELATWNYGGR